MIEIDIQNLTSKIESLEHKIEALMNIVKPADDKRFISVKDASQMFGISQQSIRHHLCKYPTEIRTSYIGGRVLIHKQSLMCFLEKHSTRATN